MDSPPHLDVEGNDKTVKSELAQSADRALALDVGDRRIGLALSDPLGHTAQPLFTLYRTNLRADLKNIARVIRKYAVHDLIVGLPLHTSGALSPQALKSHSLAEALRERHPSVRVHLLDERLTTTEAHSLLDRSRVSRQGKTSRQKRTAIIDQVAAVLLLDAFLSKASPRLLPPPPDL